MELEQKYNMDEVCKNLETRLSKSKVYKDFINSLIKNANVSKCINKLEKESSRKLDDNFIEDVFKDVGYVKLLSLMLGLENEFCEMMLLAAKEENIFSSIINTKFVETIYGNPDKKDLSLNDALFTILESVFGLDSIINSLTDDSALIKRFDVVMGNQNPNLANEFSSLINGLYDIAKDAKSYDEITSLIKNHSYDLRTFILAGLNKQNDEIMKDPNGNYGMYKVLYNNILNLIGRADSKNM